MFHRRKLLNLNVLAYQSCTPLNKIISIYLFIHTLRHVYNLSRLASQNKITSCFIEKMVEFKCLKLFRAKCPVVLIQALPSTHFYVVGPTTRDSIFKNTSVGIPLHSPLNVLEFANKITKHLMIWCLIYCWRIGKSQE